MQDESGVLRSVRVQPMFKQSKMRSHAGVSLSTDEKTEAQLVLLWPMIIQEIEVFGSAQYSVIDGNDLASLCLPS